MPNDVESVRHTLMGRVFLAQLILIAAITILVGAATVWNIGAFWFAFAGGILGGSIALIKRIECGNASQLDQVFRSWYGLLMPLLYGGVMAIIAYGFFMAQILSGEGGGGLLTTNLFPSFTDLEGERVTAMAFRNMRPKTLQDLGKLLIWCFLAGYSERFIINILGRMEQVSTPAGSTEDDN